MHLTLCVGRALVAGRFWESRTRMLCASLFLQLTHGTILGSSVVPRDIAKDDLICVC